MTTCILITDSPYIVDGTLAYTIRKHDALLVEINDDETTAIVDLFFPNVVVRAQVNYDNLRPR